MCVFAELTRDDRKKLYSNFGLLYPHGHNELSIAEDFDQIRAAMEKVPAYANVFNKVGIHIVYLPRVENTC
jgi:V-type H+-transporting ATPase subunit d